jgi:hypothetical protein
LELPDFFKDPSDFAPLVAVWRDFLRDAPSPSTPSPPEPASAAKELEDRPDWESFIRHLRGLPEASLPAPGLSAASDLAAVAVEEEEMERSPLTTDLKAVAELMRVGSPEEGDDPKKRKPGASDRKKISDAARVEGFLVLPNLGIAGKEYHWDDTLVLAPFPLGARPSLDYNASALLLEYACALSGLLGTEALEDFNAMRKRLDDYFSLSSDDQARLEALSNVFLAPSAKVEPDNLGECLQFWLQREDRAAIRDFLVLFLTTERTEERQKELVREIRASLDVEEGSPPTPQSVEERLELGQRVGKILAPLFKD